MTMLTFAFFKSHSLFFIGLYIGGSHIDILQQKCSMVIYTVLIADNNACSYMKIANIKIT